MDNYTRAECPRPFIDEASWPYQGGYLGGRLCASVPALGNASCCIPCPLQDYVYSDMFGRNVEIAFWLSVGTLIFQVFLMLSFWFLPKAEGHGHYLNWGLTMSVSFLALCMIVPLGAKPNPCHDPITPNDMYTSASCAWSGALLLAGAMGVVSWILMRSLYTHLRVVWGLELPSWFPWVSHAIGWGLPGLGLAIALPITGLAYAIGPLCLLQRTASFATYFSWYLTFSAIAGTIQLSTTGYVLWVFGKSLREKPELQSTATIATGTSVDEVMKARRNSPTVSGMYRKKHAWRRVRQVLLLQWRSILLSALVVSAAMYFGAAYVMFLKTAQQQAAGSNSAPQVLDWVFCLVINQGDKNQCLDLAAKLGVTEGTAVAAFILLAFIGVFTFSLLVRRSMFTGWYRVLQHPAESYSRFRRRRSSIEENFVIVSGDKQQNVESSRLPRRSDSPHPQTKEEEKEEEDDVVQSPFGDHHEDDIEMVDALPRHRPAN